jgi:hypothetical protein
MQSSAAKWLLSKLNVYLEHCNTAKEIFSLVLKYYYTRNNKTTICC